MSQTAVRCTGAHCNKLVIWDDLNGKPHPYDRMVHKKCAGKGFTASVQGDLFSGKALGQVRCEKCHGTGMVLRSHFQSCPDAQKFRRAKR